MDKIIFLTILVTRLSLFIIWNTARFSSQKTDFWHHMYTGIVLMLFSLFLHKKYKQVIFGIGIGLFLDEFIHLFHLMGMVKETDYWSFTSIATTITGFLGFVAITRVMRKLA